MKRFLTLTAVLLIAAGAQAQDAVTGETTTKATSEKTVKAPKTDAPACTTPATKWIPGDIHCTECCGECECCLKVPKQTYINLSTTNTNLKMMGGAGMRSNMGAAFEVGKTFFFNGKKPLVVANAAEVRFGLDASFLDLQVNKWNKSVIAGEEMYYAHVGMQFGPSVTVTPLKNMNIRLYGHYAPSFAVLTLGDDVDAGGMYGFTGYMTGGLHVSYKFVTLGVELRGATSNMNKVSADNFMPDVDIPEGAQSLDDIDVQVKMKAASKVDVKLPGVRWTLGFRF